jgi:hypothetical protein
MRIAVRSFAALAGLLLALTVALTALAADAVPTVEVSGVVLDTDGQSAEVESARVVEFETPDSDGVTTVIEVAEDGTFTVALREWGTPEAPARAQFFVTGPRGEPVIINEEGCTETTSPSGTLDLEIPGVVPTEPVEIVLDQIVVDGLCPPATATPEPGAQAPKTPTEEAPAPAVTLPPTDVEGASRANSQVTGVISAFLLLAGTTTLALAALVRRRAMGELRPRTVSSTRRRRPRGR